MTIDEFALKVRQLRHTQRRYEHFGGESIRKKKEAAEAEIDALLVQIFNRKQVLFNNSGVH